MKIPKTLKIEKAVSKDVTRLAICEPYFDAEASKVIATDGRIMAVVDVDKEEGDSSSHVPVKALEHARKLGGKYDPASIELKEKEAILNDGTTIPVHNDCIFPSSWPLILKDAEESAQKGRPFKIGINAKLLYNLALALGSDELTLNIGLLEEGKQQMNRIVVLPNKGEGIEKAKGIIMPIRIA